jgi:A/G-specific adenine glycosylase
MSENINGLIINWYKENKRDLPWRNTHNPYLIWLSEIILQQTRVNQGMSYYLKFVTNFPTVTDLANASEQNVLNNWQGLGYYSRARNLHKTAQIISTQFEGVFPTSYSEIIKLPGIGDYTASAISSFAFQEPQAVLDGNVFRVLSRIFNINTPIDSTEGKKEFRNLAQAFLDNNQPATHNQAMMEFGAMLCTPKNPSCDICPIRLHCQAYSEKTILELPFKAKKTKVRNRKMIYLFAKSGNSFLIQKRIQKDIWQHLYQFPLLELDELVTDGLKLEFEKEFKSELMEFRFLEMTTHLLSHQKLNIEFYSCELTNLIKSKDYILVNLEQSKDFPFPKPIEAFLKNLPDLVNN